MIDYNSSRSKQKELDQFGIKTKTSVIQLISIKVGLSLEKKLHKISKRLNQIDERINKIDQKFDEVKTKIDNLEFKRRIDKFDRFFIQSEEIIEKLLERIEFLQNFKTRREKTQIMKEFYDKRMNILIHGIKEDGDSVWEKRK